jgi:AcrR family transcriptional regulator
MDDIARRAKVGVGTVYRHFPTKDALLGAVAEDRFAEMAAFAREALEIDDPWQALAGFVRRSAALQVSDRALTEVLQAEPDLMSAAAERSGLVAAGDELVARGQAAGVLRSDVRARDLGMIGCALGSLGKAPGWSWERMLGIVLDGLRADAARAALPD